jgi:hypothetical protein
MNEILCKDLCEALGWQGGTIWQVIEEIKRLKKEENKSCDGCRYDVKNGIWYYQKCPNCKRNLNEKDLYEK